MDKIEELENKIRELYKELNIFKKNSAETSRWRADNEDEYYIIDDEGISSRSEHRSNYDSFRYDIGNYFKKESQAEKQLEKLTIYQQLKDLALELNNGEKIDFGNNKILKFRLYYNFDIDEIEQSSHWAWQDIGQVYCLDKNFLEIAKERIGEENLKKIFEEK